MSELCVGDGRLALALALDDLWLYPTLDFLQ